MNTPKDTPIRLFFLRFFRIFGYEKHNCKHEFTRKSVTTFTGFELPVVESYDECVKCKKRTNQHNGVI